MIEVIHTLIILILKFLKQRKIKRKTTSAPPTPDKSVAEGLFILVATPDVGNIITITATTFDVYMMIMFDTHRDFRQIDSLFLLKKSLFDIDGGGDDGGDVDEMWW